MYLAENLKIQKMQTIKTKQKKIHLMKFHFPISPSKKFPGMQIITVLMLLLLFLLPRLAEIMKQQAKTLNNNQDHGIISTGFFLKLILKRNCLLLTYNTHCMCSRAFLDISWKLKDALCLLASEQVQHILQ